MKIFVALCFLLCIDAQSKIVVEKVDFPKKVAIVKVVQRIQYEEDLIFKKLLDQLSEQGFSIKNNAIVFDTKGGSSHAAKEIGKIIRNRKLNTFVAANAECGSACIYAIIGGVVRNVYGDVSVHRTSYNDTVPLEKLKKFIDWNDAVIYKHIYEMGINSKLAIEILNTPHWTSRRISKVELDNWSINGTNRLYEEFRSRLIASELNSSVDDIQEILHRLIFDCDTQVREFTISQWDCIRVKYYWDKRKIPSNKIPPKAPSYLLERFNYNKSQNLLRLDN